VKVIDKRLLDELEKKTPGIKDKTVKALKREAQIQIEVKSPYIVDMYACHESTNNIYFFIEYCPDGDLEQYIKKNGPALKFETALKFFK
jgi:serine/threonine protein kinase